MRVTSEMMVGSTVQRLSSRMAQYERAQSKLATGKEIRRPSDDPSRANRGLSLRSTERSRLQEQRNAEDAKSWLHTTDSSLQSSMDRIQRARELAVQGSNEGLSQHARDALAEEVATIRAEIVEIGNTRLRGQHIFAGYRNEAAVTGGPGDWEVVGDPDDAIERRVGDGDKVRVNTTATEAFGAGQDSAFAVLDRLEARLRGDDTAPVASSLTEIDDVRERLGGEMARIGANTNWVESAVARSEDSLHTLRTELSEVEDADFAEAVMDLQVQDMGLQATLQALGRSLPPSLAAFLR